MIVEEIMKTNIITLSPKDTIFEAYQLMLQHNVRHLPIVNENHEHYLVLFPIEIFVMHLLLS